MKAQTVSSSFSFKVEEPCERLDLFLSRKTEQSRRFVKEQIESGKVTLNAETVTKPSQKLRVGDEVSGVFEEEFRTELTPIAHPLEILFEDEHLVVINKEQGVVVHPAAGHRGETLVHYLLHHLRSNQAFAETSTTRPGIVHRLDRGTSGIILVAKNRLALESLSRQFKSREIKKEYESIVWGRLAPEGTFTGGIGRDPHDRKKMSSRSLTAREALTRWKTNRTFAHFSHVALFPHTGRTHQLRVHLSENGNAIVGDALYGRSSLGRRRSLLPTVIRNAVNALPHTLLHARAISFRHPRTEAPLSFSAGRPASFDNFLSLLEDQDR